MRKCLFVSMIAVILFTLAVPNNVAAGKWEKTGGKTYYLNDSGKKVTGWQTIDGEKYYFSSKGVMKKGWMTLKSGKTFYFKNDGKMVTGWFKKDGNTYYFKNNGVMETGDDDGNAVVDKMIYCFREDGTMIDYYKDGVVKISGKYYILDKKGQMYKDKMVPVTFDDGDVLYYYVGEKGYVVSGKKRIDGVLYTFDVEKGVIGEEYEVKTNIGSGHTQYNYKGAGIANFKGIVTVANGQCRVNVKGIIRNTNNAGFIRVRLRFEFYDENDAYIIGETTDTFGLEGRTSSDFNETYNMYGHRVGSIRITEVKVS